MGRRISIVAILACLAGAASAADVGAHRMVWAHYVPWFTPNNVSLMPRKFFNFPVDEAAPDPFRNEIRRALDIGIDGFFADVFVHGDSTAYGDLRPYLRAAEGSGFQFAICLDGRAPAERLEGELARMLALYGDHPNYARAGGRYVVGTYAFVERGADEWRRIRTACEEAGYPLFLVANVERGLDKPVDEEFLQPFAGTFERAYFFAHTGYAGLSSIQEARNVQSFGERLGADFMPCLYPGYFGNWTAGINDYYQPFRGIDRIHETFMEAMGFHGKVPWLHVTSWNDHGETALMPCRLTPGTAQLLRAYADAWKGLPLPERADVVFAYHREELPGTWFRIEAMRLPSAETGPLTVGGCLADIDGNGVASLTPRVLGGDWARAEWIVPTDSLAASPCLVPQIVVNGGRRGRFSLPPMFFRTPWLENPVTIRTTASQRRDILNSLKVSWADNVLAAELTFKAPVDVRRAVLIRNDRPIGQFSSSAASDTPCLNVGWTCRHTGGVKVEGGRILAAVKSNEAENSEGAATHFFWDGSRCESTMTPPWKSFSAALSGAPGMLVTFTTDGKDAARFTTGELLGLGQMSGPGGNLRLTPDLTLFDRPALMRSNGTFRTSIYTPAITVRDVFWVEFILADGTHCESRVVWPMGTHSCGEAIPVLATDTTIETASGATGRRDRAEWLTDGMPENTGEIVLTAVSMPARHRLEYSFEDNGLELSEGRDIAVPKELFGDGRNGRGLVFTGAADESVMLPRRVSIMGAGQISFWIKPAPADGVKRSVVGKSGWGEGVAISILPDGRIEAVWSAGYLLIAARTAISAEPLPASTWTHVNVRLEPGSMHLVLNGKADALADLPVIRCYGNVTCSIGAADGLPAFRGSLDELSIGAVEGDPLPE